MLIRSVQVPHRRQVEGKLRNIQEGRRVGKSAASLDATADALNRASFATVDVLRRALGHALGAFGLDPDECPYRIVGFGPPGVFATMAVATDPCPC